MLGPAMVAVTTASQLFAADINEFSVRRQEVFEFTERPKIVREGDQVTIRFAVKAYCDATVAIEERSGFAEATRPGRFSDPGVRPRIVRHLASGVLGPNAPAPFQKDSLKQRLVWDGKDDRGDYLDQPDAAVVRVSLGLKPQFERTLFWSPHKRLTGGKAIDADALRLCARPEGVYVSDGTGVDSVRLFDHDGHYVRTVYPFPADRIAQVKDLEWITLPQGGPPVPLGRGMMHATLLTCGSSADADNKYGYAAQFLAACGDRLATGFRTLNRLGTDGSSGGLAMEGPPLAQEVVIGREDMWAGGKKTRAAPRSAAFSPDGKRLYLSGYGWTGLLGRAQEWLSGVTQMEFAADAPPTLLAGSMKQGDHGAAEGRFHWAVWLAVDSRGRVYVADHLNDRIQVFDADGRFIKAIAVVRPTFVGVHHGTGEIYVLSWRLGSDDAVSVPGRTPKFTRFSPLDDPKVLATHPLTVLKDYDLGRGGSSRLLGGGMQYVASLDSWADPPTIWLGTGRGHPIVLLSERDGKLEVRRDFAEDIARAVVRATPPIIQRQRLSVNPADGMLYVAEGDSGVMKSFKQLVEIAPDSPSGRVRLVDLPFDAEDLCIDLDGKFYLRTDVVVARYDPHGWREVPWDYGEERRSVTFGGDGRSASLVAGLALPATGRPGWWHGGGMAVNAKGHLAVTCYNTSSKAIVIDGTRPVSADTDAKRGTKNVHLPRTYTPPAFPGRDPDWQIHVWDEHGRVIVRDAAPGLARTDGIGLDKDDNLYVLSSGIRMLGGKPYPVATAGTLLKLRPGRTRLLRTGADVPVPLEGEAAPGRPPDMLLPNAGRAWVEDAEWLYGGAGLNNMACICWNARPALDLFARSFAPQINHHSVAVLDGGGNLIVTIGRYGNVDDGRPIVTEGGPSGPRSVGGDEVSLMFGAYLATHSDRRLFIADAGNSRIVSVRLGYHAQERVPLKDAVGDN